MSQLGSGNNSDHQLAEQDNTLILATMEEANRAFSAFNTMQQSHERLLPFAVRIIQGVRDRHKDVTVPLDADDRQLLTLISDRLKRVTDGLTYVERTEIPNAADVEAESDLESLKRFIQWLMARGGYVSLGGVPAASLSAVPFPAAMMAVPTLPVAPQAFHTSIPDFADNRFDDPDYCPPAPVPPMQCSRSVGHTDSASVGSASRRSIREYTVIQSCEFASNGNDATSTVSPLLFYRFEVIWPTRLPGPPPRSDDAASDISVWCVACREFGQPTRDATLLSVDEPHRPTSDDIVTRLIRHTFDPKHVDACKQSELMRSRPDCRFWTGEEAQLQMKIYRRSPLSTSLELVRPGTNFGQTAYAIQSVRTSPREKQELDAAIEFVPVDLSRILIVRVESVVVVDGFDSLEYVRVRNESQQLADSTMPGMMLRYPDFLLYPHGRTEFHVSVRFKPGPLTESATIAVAFLIAKIDEAETADGKKAKRRRAANLKTVFFYFK